MTLLSRLIAWWRNPLGVPYDGKGHWPPAPERAPPPPVQQRLSKRVGSNPLPPIGAVKPAPPAGPPASDQGSRPTLRAVISRVNICNSGELSVVLRFGIEDWERAQGLTPGSIVEIVLP